MNHRRSKVSNGNPIPPPPGPKKGYAALIEYFNKYSTDELERAGHLEKAPPEAIHDLELAAACDLLRSTGLHVQLSRKECERLLRLAAADNISVNHLVKTWLKERMRLEAHRASKTSRTHH
jgi:hypothetical protein